MTYKQSKKISALDVLFFSHISIVSWVILVPFLIYFVGDNTFFIFSITIIVHIVLLYLGLNDFKIIPNLASHKNNEYYKILENLTFKFFIISVTTFISFFTVFSSISISDQLSDINIFINPQIFKIIIILLVFLLGILSIKTLGLVCRIISIPLIVFISQKVLIDFPTYFFNLNNNMNLIHSYGVLSIHEFFEWIILSSIYIYFTSIIRSFSKGIKKTENLILRKNNLFWFILVLIISPIIGLLYKNSLHINIINLISLHDINIDKVKLFESNFYSFFVLSTTIIVISQLCIIVPKFVLLNFKNNIFQSENYVRFYLLLLTLIFSFCDFKFLLNISNIFFTLFIMFLCIIRLKYANTISKILQVFVLSIFIYFIFKLYGNQSLLYFSTIVFIVFLTYFISPAINHLQSFYFSIQNYFYNKENEQIKTQKSKKSLYNLVKSQLILQFGLFVVIIFIGYFVNLKLSISNVGYKDIKYLDINLSIMLFIYLILTIINTVFVLPKIHYYEKINKNINDNNSKLEEDVKKYKNSESELRYLNNHDTQTGVFTRNYIINKITNHLKNQTPFIACHIDIDEFKKFNTIFGYKAGDYLLKDIICSIQNYFGVSCVLSRFSGDEYIFLVKNYDKDDVLIKLNEILYHYKKEFYFDNMQLKVQLKIGIYEYFGQDVTVDSVIKNLDFTLRYSKETAIKKIIEYDENINDIFSERINIENEIDYRIKNKNTTPFYQPIFDQSKNKIIGFEQLMRINLNGKYVLPKNFISIAEETGKINDLGWLSFEQAALTKKKLNDLGFVSEYISINVSANQFLQVDFLSRFKSICKENNVTPNSMRIEITESVMLEEMDTLISILNDLTLSGFKLYLDDFGTGFSNISYLKTLPLDTLKIDQSFIRKEDNTSRAVVTAIVKLARELALTVIVEGVETKNQSDLLKQLKVKYIQGYLISKPVIYDDMIDLLKKYNAN
jgi:diguanylate cyclase (GGDEF)-like protein